MANQYKIPFAKMHGLGNDMVIFDFIEEERPLNSKIIRQLSDRHQGIGFDQLITISRSKENTDADFFCRIFNTDGSMAEQCGNGLRCVARYLHEHRRHASKKLTIQTIAGIFPIVIHDYADIVVTMNSPTIIDNKLILTLTNHDPINAVSLLVGNPHIIIHIDDDVKQIDIQSVGAALATHPHFPHGTNVGFMRIDHHELTLRTYERGVGRTLACGSNACAAAVAAITSGLLSSPVTVNVERGSLEITWDGNDTLMMRGRADNCYEGIVSI